MEPTSHFYDARGLRLHYVDWGIPNGSPDLPPLVLVHGGLDHCRSWDWIARAFRDEYRVLAIDLAGHGDSDHAAGGAYAPTDYAFDLAEFVRRVGLDRISLIGHSMGGGVASLFAGLFPEKINRLVLIEGLRPAMQPLEPAPDRLRSWVDQMRDLSRRRPRAYASIEEAARRMRDSNPRLSADQALHLTKFGLMRGVDGAWRWKYDNYVRARVPVRLALTEIAALWARISAPVLLVGGSESGRPNPVENGWLEMFPHAESVMIPAAGHWVHHDALDVFAPLLRAFLQAEGDIDATAA